MKVISGFFKVIAFILMMAVIISLPASLFLRSLGNIVFSPDDVVALVEASILDTETMATIAEEVVKESALTEDSSVYDALLLSAFQNFTHENWVNLLEMAAPPEATVQTLSDILRGYYAWIDNDELEPEFTLDTRPWKQHLTNNIVPATEMTLNALPPCSLEDIQTFTINFLSGNNSDLPLCRPPEPIYSTFINSMVETIAPEYLAGIPDEVSFTGPMTLSPQEVTLMKQNIQATRLGMSIGWIGIIVLYFIAVLMGARSVPGYLRWAGWPLLISGALLLFLGVSMLLSTEALSAGLLATSMDMSGGLANSVVAVFSAILLTIARPTIVQAVVLIVVGGGALVIATFVPDEEQELTAVQMTAEETAAIAQEASPLDPNWPPLAQPTQPRPDEDDDAPTGMFG